MELEQADLALEYFPDDGYDYEQHFISDDKKLAFTSFIIEPDNLAAKWKDPVFRGQLEKNVEEMDEDELEILKELQEGGNEEADDETEAFLTQLIPKGRLGVELTKHHLWGGETVLDQVVPPQLSPLTRQTLDQLQKQLDDRDLDGTESVSGYSGSGAPALLYDNADFERAVRGLDSMSEGDEDDYDGEQIEQFNAMAAEFMRDKKEKEDALTLNQIQSLNPDVKDKILSLLEQQSSEDVASDYSDERLDTAPAIIHYQYERRSHTVAKPKRKAKPKKLTLNDLI